MESVKDLEKQLDGAESDLEMLNHWIKNGDYPKAGVTKEDLEADRENVKKHIKSLKTKLRKAKAYEEN